MQRYLSKEEVLRSLRKKGNFLVRCDGYNGEIRDLDGEIHGYVSSKICDKIISDSPDHNVQHVGTGTGLLAHEKYYAIKNN